MLCACLNRAVEGPGGYSICSHMRGEHGVGIINEAKARAPNAKISNVETLSV